MRDREREHQPDRPDQRRAVTPALDRKAFIDLIGEGQGEIGAAMQPPPNGAWECRRTCCTHCPAMTPILRRTARRCSTFITKLGYGPNTRVPVTVTTRNVAAYRGSAVILIDQLKKICIDGTFNRSIRHSYPTVMRKDYRLAFTVTGLDDPDQMFHEIIPAGRNATAPGSVIQRSTS